MAVTEHQRQELVALREMMSTPGWAVFTREMRKDRENMNKSVLASVTNEAGLFFAKGMDEIMNRILNYDKILDAAEVQGEAE